MAKTAEPEKLYAFDSWRAALKKVGVDEEKVLKASILMLEEDIKKSKQRLKSFKPGKR